MTQTLGSELAAMRKVIKKRCAHCNKDIQGLKSKKYCNESCKQKAKRARAKFSEN